MTPRERAIQVLKMALGPDWKRSVVLNEVEAEFRAAVAEEREAAIAWILAANDGAETQNEKGAALMALADKARQMLAAPPPWGRSRIEAEELAPDNWIAEANEAVNRMVALAKQKIAAAVAEEREAIINAFPLPKVIDSSDPYMRGRIDQAVEDAAAIRARGKP